MWIRQPSERYLGNVLADVPVLDAIRYGVKAGVIDALNFADQPIRTKNAFGTMVFFQASQHVGLALQGFGFTSDTGTGQIQLQAPPGRYPVPVRFVIVSGEKVPDGLNVAEKGPTTRRALLVNHAITRAQIPFAFPPPYSEAPIEDPVLTVTILVQFGGMTSSCFPFDSDIIPELTIHLAIATDEITAGGRTRMNGLVDYEVIYRGPIGRINKGNQPEPPDFTPNIKDR